MTALSDSLIDSRSLRTLDLSNCNMDSEGAKAIGVGLQVMLCMCLCVCLRLEYLAPLRLLARSLLLTSLICMRIPSFLRIRSCLDPKQFE